MKIKPKKYKCKKNTKKLKKQKYFSKNAFLYGFF